MRSLLHLHFRRYYREHGLVEPGERLLVAVSGGVDSVVLLDLLLRWKVYDKLHLEIVHLNHQLRGDESEEDAKFVQQLAHQHYLVCHLLTADVGAYAKKQRLSLEEAGRNLRKSMFEEICEKEGLDKIVTAHHADDQAETVLMRLLKGAGVEGMAGIRKKNGLWVRPLLFATRKEIETYARKNNLQYRTDSSNLSGQFLRNRFRNELIPFLEREYNPSLKKKLQSLAEMFGDFQEFAEKVYWDFLQDQRIQLFENKIRLEIPSFNLYFTGLQFYLVKQVVARLTGEESYPGFDKFRRFLFWVRNSQTGSFFPWGGGIEVWHLGDWVEFRTAEAGRQAVLKVEAGIWYHLPGSDIQLFLEPVAENEVKFHGRGSEEFLCGENFKMPLLCRIWQPGDRFRPLGMQSRKKVSDYLTDKKISGVERQKQWVLLNNDEIVSVIGVGISNDYKVKKNCKSIYRLIIKRR
ncbi:MAG: tRNA lysidine(34) synthetase TilS [Calditrichia bacterium]